MPPRISLSIENQVAYVRLNRPDKHNALDLAMFRAIADTQRQLRRESDVRVVLLSGEGVDFCSGLDVKALMSDRAGMVRLLWKWWPWRPNLAQVVSVGWSRLAVPVIAAVQGRCWGGGLQIAFGADFRIAQPGTSFSIMEGKWGLIPDMGGTLALRDLTGRDQAMKLAMTAEEFSAQRALELGLVTALADDPVTEAGDWAKQIAERSPDAVAAVKRLFRKSWNGSAGAALARETLYQVRNIRSGNQRIAVRRQRGEDRPYRPRRRW